MSTRPQNTVTAALELSQRRILVIIGALLLGMLLAALYQAIVATALPTIAGDLHGLSELSWVVTAYILASTASTPLRGKLGDLYGRITFLPGSDRDLPSQLGAVGNQPDDGAADRAVQGIGGGGLMITPDLLPRSTRSRCWVWC